MITGLRDKAKFHQYPDDALSCYALARFFWEHFEQTEILLFHSENSIFTGDEELALYNFYLNGTTSVVHQEQRFGVIFQTTDRERLINLLSLNMLFKWDCLLATSAGHTVIQFSHDGLFGVSSSDAPFLAALGQLGYR